MRTQKLNRSPTARVHDKKPGTLRVSPDAKIKLPPPLTVVRRDVLPHVPLF